MRPERQRPAGPKCGCKPLSAPSLHHRNLHPPLTTTQPDTCPQLSTSQTSQGQQVHGRPPPWATPGRNPADAGQGRSLSPHPAGGLTLPGEAGLPRYRGGAIRSRAGTGEGRTWPPSRPWGPEALLSGLLHPSYKLWASKELLEESELFSEWAFVSPEPYGGTSVVPGKLFLLLLKKNEGFFCSRGAVSQP